MKRVLKKGFTLAELVITLAVSSILITISIVFINFVSNFTLSFEEGAKELYASDTLSSIIRTNVNKAKAATSSITYFDCDSTGKNIDSSITESMYPSGYTKNITCLYYYENGSNPITVWYGSSDNDVTNKKKLFYLDYKKTSTTPNVVSDAFNINLKGSKKMISTTTKYLMVYTLTYKNDTRSYDFSIEI